jgi:3-isopropylmalate/(R)-2-methylmalate dehydratase small subunit
VISTSFADIFKNNALKNALLPIAVDPQTHRALLALGADAELPIDLESQSLTLPDGSRTAFEVDPFAKYLLLEGVDELGFILQQEDAIAAYEASRPGTLNTLAA